MESDLRTLRPIASLSSYVVDIIVNGEVLVPSSGILTAAQIHSRSSEPFRITRNVNDTFVVTVNGVTSTVTLPNGNSVRASTIASALSAITGLSAQARLGRIQLTLDQPGPLNSLGIGTGSANTVLGFADNRVAKGRVSAPGWRLVKDPLRVGENARNIVFDTKWRSPTDTFWVSYYTTRPECRRCRGFGLENDIRFSGSDTVFAEGAELLLQEVSKAILTLRGSNPFHTWYGTNITGMIGSKFITDVIRSQIVSEVTSSIQIYRELKAKQARLQTQSLGETLFRVEGIEVIPSTTDPTVIGVFVRLRNAANELTDIETVFTVPGVVSLINGFQHSQLG